MTVTQFFSAAGWVCLAVVWLLIIAGTLMESGAKIPDYSKYKSIEDVEKASSEWMARSDRRLRVFWTALVIAALSFVFTGVAAFLELRAGK